MATTIAPAVRFIENRPGSIDINYYLRRTIECLNEMCTKREYTPSRIFKGSANHRYFYIYFYMPIEKIRKALNAIAVTFQNSMRNKVVVITYLNGAYTETLIAPQLPKPPIRTIAAPSFSSVPKKPSPRAAAGYKDIKTPSGVSGQKYNSTNNKYSIPTNAEIISKYLLSDLLQISSYDYLLGKGNLPDKLLVKLIKGMREESRKKEFKKKILSSVLLTPIDIDGSPFDFAINIKFEEAVQNGGIVHSNRKLHIYLLMQSNKKSCCCLKIGNDHHFSLHITQVTGCLLPISFIHSIHLIVASKEVFCHFQL